MSEDSEIQRLRSQVQFLSRAIEQQSEAHNRTTQLQDRRELDLIDRIKELKEELMLARGERTEAARELKELRSEMRLMEERERGMNGRSKELESLTREVKRLREDCTMLRSERDSADMLAKKLQTDFDSERATLKRLLEVTQTNLANEARWKKGLADLLAGGDISQAYIQAAARGIPDAVAAILADSRISESVNAQDFEGDTALANACSYGHLEVVKVLLADPRVDVSIRNNRGWQAIHWAACNGHADVLRALTCHRDVIPDSRNAHQSTPFLLAAQYGHTECLKVLYECGVDINARDNDRDSGLMCAAIQVRKAPVREVPHFVQTRIAMCQQTIEYLLSLPGIDTSGFVRPIKLSRN